MSDYYGKAVFTDGSEAFLVYRTSPGWTLSPLFTSLTDAMEWHEAGCPPLERDHYAALERSKATEEPVHILISVDYPEKESMWFYSFASKTDMVITGPSSELQAQESNERGDGLFTKEFFDAWVPKAQRRPRRNYDDDPQP